MSDSVDNDEMGDRRVVQCDTHGPRRPAFICHHLVRGSALGFFAPDDPSGDLQGWCGACEKVRAQRGGWDDESEGFARVTLVCDLCYQVAKERNAR
jgi:hypothetical protein